MEPILSAFGVDYYLVGAVARDIQLGADAESTRKTQDVDIAVLINDENRYYELKEALIATGKFDSHPNEAIKLYFKKAIEVDLLPFGEIESAEREIRLSKPKLFVLKMPGLREAFPSIERIAIADGFMLNVCSIEGLILLKLIANDDRPNRTKDIDDIEHLIAVYFGLNDEEVYTDYFDVMDLYDTGNRDYLKLIGARIIGRKMNALLHASDLKDRVIDILKRRLQRCGWLCWMA